MENKLTGIVLQARLDSTRLPGKAMLLLDGKPLIYRVMEALNNVPADLRILACTEDSLSAFAPLAEEAGFYTFAGPKDDVLERFCKVISHFSLKRVIRATGDNPFVFSDAAMAINAEGAAIKADYSGYLGLPYGAGVEAISADALLRAGKEATSPYDREHVCPYLYTHSELFSLHRPLAPLRWQGSNIRLTVDTQEDFDRAKELYTMLKVEKFHHYGYAIISTYFSIKRSYETCTRR
jgi:spore coat polysaccharide biosynthesis protein SpsF